MKKRMKRGSMTIEAGGEEGKRNLHASVQLLAMSALDVLSE